ncbi:MAG: alpha/beta fold hydrolase [Pseudomonadota bacterium]
MPYYKSRDGHTLHYHEMGRGPVCILIHGFGMQAALWKTLVWPLRRRYRFIMPDLRGFNGSRQASFADDQTVFEHFADDLADLIDHLGEDTVSVAGYSMGGSTAMTYQLRHGTERIRSYAQIDQVDTVTNHESWQWGIYGPNQEEKLAHFRTLFDELDRLNYPEHWDRLPRSFRQNLLSHFTDFIASTAARPSWKRAIQQMGQWGLVERSLPADQWPAFARCMRDYTCETVDFSAVFEDYDRPLWVLTGSESELYDARGQTLMAQKVPGSRQVMFDGCGHLLIFERPLRFIKTLDAFMRTAV